MKIKQAIACFLITFLFARSPLFAQLTDTVINKPVDTLSEKLDSLRQKSDSVIQVNKTKKAADCQ